MTKYCPELAKVFPVDVMVKRGWIDADIEDTPAVEKAILDFFAFETEEELWKHLARFALVVSGGEPFPKNQKNA